jgi:hypothetical protein
VYFNYSLADGVPLLTAPPVCFPAIRDDCDHNSLIKLVKDPGWISFSQCTRDAPQAPHRSGGNRVWSNNTGERCDVMSLLRGILRRPIQLGGFCMINT